MLTDIVRVTNYRIVSYLASLLTYIKWWQTANMPKNIKPQSANAKYS